MDGKDGVCLPVGGEEGREGERKKCLQAKFRNTIRPSNFLPQGIGKYGKDSKINYINQSPAYLKVDFEQLIDEIQHSPLFLEGNSSSFQAFTAARIRFLAKFRKRPVRNDFFLSGKKQN